MAIRTHQSISGFVASDPQLSYTDRGAARLYMKVGIEHYRKEPDNTSTQLETTFHGSGAVTVNWNVAFRSGCSNTANTRRESGTSNCE